MSSKFAAKRPKYTPPKVCTYSPIGPTWRYVDGNSDYLPIAFAAIASAWMKTDSAGTISLVRFAWKIPLTQSPNEWSGSSSYVNNCQAFAQIVAIIDSPNWTVYFQFTDALQQAGQWNRPAGPLDFRRHPPIRYDGSWPQVAGAAGMQIQSAWADQAA